VGFTIPRSGAFYLCDHDAVWKVKLGPKVTAELTDLAPYSFVEANDDFLGLVFEGLKENPPLKKVGAREISYDFKEGADAAHLRYLVDGEERGQIQFSTFSSAWFVASFSDDGRFLILAEPYDLSIFEC